MPLQNYVIFKSGVPERLHFSNYTYEQVPVTSPETGRAEMRNRLLLDVDEENGRKTDERGLPIIAKLSILAEGLADKIEPYLPGDAYKKFDFVITQTGAGRQIRYSVQVIPRS